MASNASLSSQAWYCASSLHALCAELEDPECKYVEQLSPRAIEEETRRFQVWAHNIGAFQDPQRQSSLAYRLREAPQVYQQVSRLLDRLSSSAKQALLICGGTLENRIEVDSDSEDGTTTNEGVSEIRELSLTINGSVTRLFKLSMAIRTPIPRDRYERLATIEPLSSVFDVCHVRERFPKAERHWWLAERLGKANAQRRDYFRYRRNHQEKLAKKTEEDHEPQGNKETALPATNNKRGENQSILRVKSSLGSTKATTYVPPSNLTSVEKAEEGSETGQSETSYATSVDEGNTGALHVPPPPPEFDLDLPFECPYCFTIQSPPSRHAWKKHVFNDLQPYVCTFESCAAKPFTSRHAWFEHELRAHRKEWICNLCEHTSFSSAIGLQSHLQEYHGEEVTERQLPTIIDLCEESLSEIFPEDCPLCNEWALVIQTRELAINPNFSSRRIVVTPVQFRRHLGSHLEQLALFALPKDHGNGITSNIDSNDAMADASSRMSFHTASSVSVSNADEIEGSSLLYTATKQSNVSEVAKLLSNGADPNYLGTDHEYPLQLASRVGNHEIVRILLEHGANVNSSGSHGTALVGALTSGKLEIARILLDYGAMSNFVPNGLNNRALRNAVKNTEALQMAVLLGLSGIVKLMLELGADPNLHPTGERTTALQNAAHLGHLEVVKNLLEHGADLHSSGQKGTALQVAANQGFRDIVNLLLDHGADLESQGPNGTALQAATSCGHLETAELLIERGANVNSPPGPNGTALQVASGYDNPKAVEMLLGHGADIASEGPLGTAIHLAVASGHIHNANILRRWGADTNLITLSGMTALQFAASHGNFEMAKFLISWGASMESPPGAEGTALQAAVFHGHLDIVKMLLDCGADPNSLPGPHGTALQAAKEHPAIEELLIAHGAKAENKMDYTDREKEKAAIFIQRTWRQNRRRASGRLTFVDSALLVYQHLKPERRAPHDCWPPNPTKIEKAWGELFDQHRRPTYRLDQIFRGLINPNFGVNFNTTAITPTEMQHFYRENGIESDELYDWDRLFTSPDFHHFGIEYHFLNSNTIPSMSPRGFSRWMTMLIQCFPVEETCRLQAIVSSNGISNPDSSLEGGPEIFPAYLPSSLLPNVPNMILREKFEDAMRAYRLQEKLELHTVVNQEEKLHSPTGETYQQEPIVANDERQLYAASLETEMAKLTRVTHSGPPSSPTSSEEVRYHISDDDGRTQREPEREEPEYRQFFKPSIDPLYGDLLPLPPSEPATPDSEEFSEFPSLPESRPQTPEAERRRSTRKSLRETTASASSNTAVPLAFKMRKSNRSTPSPGFPGATPSRSETIPIPRKSRGPPTSWDSSREYQALYLAEKSRRRSTLNNEDDEQQLEPSELPPLPDSRPQTPELDQQLEPDEPQ